MTLWHRLSRRKAGPAARPAVNLRTIEPFEAPFLGRWLRFWPFYRPAWTCLGIVRGLSQLVDEKGAEIPGALYVGFWVLEQCDNGRRRAQLVGNPGASELGVLRQAQVTAWLAGGPLPPIEPDPRQEHRSATKLVVLPGGRIDG